MSYIVPYGPSGNLLIRHASLRMANHASLSVPNVRVLGLKLTSHRALILA